MKRLYNEDSFQFDFEAIVTDCFYDEKKNLYGICLDQTAFFPEGGGQLSDLGFLYLNDTIKEIAFPVLDVQEKALEVVHYLSSPFVTGQKVRGRVDRERRFDFMQQHSGEHIFSGLVHRYFEADNVGFHLGLSEVTLDFNVFLDWEQLRKIEDLANQAIWENLPVQTEFPSPLTLESMEYRSKLELTENVRIVTIPGYDVCACCAPHVKNTGQIGLLKVTSVQSHRGGVRVNILCGNRALADYTNKQENIFAISNSLSSKQHLTSQAVERLKEENLSLKEENNILQTKLLQEISKGLPSPEKSPHIVMILEPMNDIAIRNVINNLTLKYSGYVAVFWGDDSKGYRYLIGSKTLDCRQIGNSLREKFDAKGGGKAPMIQGTVLASGETLRDFIFSL